MYFLLFYIYFKYILFIYIRHSKIVDWYITHPCTHTVNMCHLDYFIVGCMCSTTLDPIQEDTCIWVIYSFKLEQRASNITRDEIQPGIERNNASTHRDSHRPIHPSSCRTSQALQSSPCPLQKDLQQSLVSWTIVLYET